MDITNVLIVEDSILVRTVLRELLSFSPMVKIEAEASTAQELWAKLEEHSIQVILLDLGLPDADALQIVEILAHQAQCGVVVISGRADNHDIALKLGATACFEKSTLIENRVSLVDAITRAACRDERRRGRA